MPVKTSIQLRRDTAANWASANPVLAAGEVGVESDTSKFKIGNGTSSWTSLVYFKESSGAVAPTVPTVTSKNTNYTIQATDANNIIEMNSASALSVTLPSDTTANIAAGQSVDIVQMGAGTVSFINEKEFAGLIPSNATTWTSLTTNNTSDIIYSAAYGNGLWIMVGSGSSGGSNRSTNGTTWTTLSTGFSSVRLFTVEYGNGRWAIGGSNGEIRTSNDGSTFNLIVSNFGTTGIRKISYGNGLWVAVGYSGQIRRSTNAVNWTTVTSNFGTGGIFSVAYGAGLWVAGSSTGQMRTSTDGTTWTTVNSNFGTTGIRSIAYGNGLWVAGGVSGVMRTSTDGTTWTTVNSNFETASIQAIAYGAGLWVAGGYNRTIARSTNGSTWVTVNTSFNNTGTNIFGVAYGNGSWIAVGGSFGGVSHAAGSFQTESFNDLSIVVNRSGMTTTQYSISTAYKTAANTWTVTNQSLGTTGT